MDTAVDTLVALKGIALLLWLALLFAAERLIPAAPYRETQDGRHGWRRLVRNGVLWGFTAALSPLVVVPVSVWAAEVTTWRPAAWSGSAAMLVDLLILDALIYWWHRANHEIPFLWRFHEVHHLDRFLDTTSAVRFHFGEVLLSAGARAVVIIALDIPWQSVLVFELLVLASAFFHHSNVALPSWFERRLSAVVVTPSIHWVHHHARRSDTDSNYATILSVWDRVFRSRSSTRRTPDMPIGVEGLAERTVVGLLIAPFFNLRRPRRHGPAAERTQ